ncbi:MAG: hypothetical protein AB7L66_18390 [Gemmatimonadales bacterium]
MTDRPIAGQKSIKTPRLTTRPSIGPQGAVVRIPAGTMSVAVPVKSVLAPLRPARTAASYGPDPPSGRYPRW